MDGDLEEAIQEFSITTDDGEVAYYFLNNDGEVTDEDGDVLSEDGGLDYLNDLADEEDGELE